MFTSFWVPSAGKMVKQSVLAALFAAVPTNALSLSDLLNGSAHSCGEQSHVSSYSQVRRDPDDILSQIQAQIEALSKMRDAELNNINQYDQLAEVDAEKATPVSAPAPKPEPPKLSPSDEYKKGLDEISKQLVDLADYLPLVKQCMKDVKSGMYTTSVAAHIANNGISDAVVDPLTGKVIRVETKKPEKMGKQSEVIELPAHAISGESDEGNGEQVYDHGFSPEDKKTRGEDEKILAKTEKQAEALPKPEKKEEGEEGGDKKEGDKKAGGEKKDGAKKDAPAGGAKKEEKKEGGAAQTGAEATTEAAADAAAKPAALAQTNVSPWTQF